MAKTPFNKEGLYSTMGEIDWMMMMMILFYIYVSGIVIFCKKYLIFFFLIMLIYTSIIRYLINILKNLVVHV